MRSNKKKVNDALRSAGTEHARERTANVIRKLRAAMGTIDSEMASNDGIYPHNFGRLTQVEVCRRAEVAKITLYSPAHIKTTRTEVRDWISSHQIKNKLAARNASVKRDVFWKEEHAKVASQICLYEQQLIEKDIQIKMLREEINVLKRKSPLRKEDNVSNLKE